MSLEIRPIQPADVDAVIDLWRRARWRNQPWLERRMGYTPDDDRAHFLNAVMPRHAVWVAVEGERVVGLMALGTDADGGGDIDQLYVDPDDWGRGLGGALLDHAKRLMPQGFTLYTHQRNERARRFYEARGLVAIASGVSPPPESEPDVRYAWRPQISSGPTLPG